MGRLINYSFCLMLLLPLGAFAQAEKTEGESVIFNGKVTEKNHLDLNTDVLLSGETLLYKVTVQSGSEKDSLNQSKIAYVRLVDKNKKVWFAHKVKIDHGAGAGSFSVPVGASSGDYKLICYTSWSRNNPDSGYFVKDILIINPFLKPKNSDVNKDERYTLSAQQNIPNNPTKSSDQIALSLDKAVYGTRELVNLDLKLSNQDLAGDYLLTVRKLSPVELQHPIPERYLGHIDKNRTYLPEFRGELLSGTINPANQNSKVGDKTVSLSIPSRDFIFKNVKTDSDGRFLFLLDKPYSSTKSVLQVIDKKPETYHIALDDNDPEIFDQLRFRKLTLDSDLKSWLQGRSIDIQIMNAYTETLGTQKEDSLPPTLFYDPFATRYRLDDYDRFPTMHETFTEILTDAAMRVDLDQVRLKVYNTENPFNDGLDKIDPLVLIDGIQIQDNILVRNLDPKNVEAIDVVPVQYRYGPSYFSGIISIITKNRDFNLLESDSQALQLDLPLPINDSGFYEKNYGSLHNAKRIPDYRVQLYWDPRLKLNKQDKQVHFYTSDQEGLFEVLMRGYDESGRVMEVKRRFWTVKQH